MIRVTSSVLLIAAIPCLGILPALSAQTKPNAAVTKQWSVEGTIQEAVGRGAPVAAKSITAALKTNGNEQLNEVALDGAITGTLEIRGKSLPVAVGTMHAETPNALWIDLNGNGSIDENEKVGIKTTARDSRGQTFLSSNSVPLTFEFGGRKMDATARLSKFGDSPARFTVRFPRYFGAATEIGGKPCTVAVVDEDMDGTFGSAGDLWGIHAGKRPLSAYALSPMTEQPFHNGHLVGLRVKDAEAHLTATPADGPDPATMAAQRVRVEHIWAKRFDGEREKFIVDKGVDTSRAKTETPVQWHYVTFDEAIAMGKKAGKPVFVDVLAFWCVWCYRMDYYTYPDAEVAQLLNEKYIPVKIVQEQDAAKDYDRVMKGKLEARGIPAMGVFDFDGNPVHKIGGWKKPSAFAADLRTGLEKFAAGN